MQAQKHYFQLYKLLFSVLGKCAHVIILYSIFVDFESKSTQNPMAQQYIDFVFITQTITGETSTVVTLQKLSNYNLK